jgi:catechol 2,3-dioxygenase-like lactoylglutathione lyase family enzyme
MADTQTSTHISAIGTVMVPVSDQDKAIEFFCEKLGFEKRTDTPYGNGDRWVDVAPPGAATTIALTSPGEQMQPGAWTAIAFSSSDIDADHEELRSRGVDVDDEVMRMGDPVPPMFWFRDPDGNSYLIVQSSA